MSNRMIVALFGILGLISGLSGLADGADPQQNKPRGVVVDFSASWCGPCQQMAPMVERLARQGFSIQSVDVDQRPDLKAKYNITSLPTFLVIVDGKEVQRRVGAMPETEVRNLLATIPAAPREAAPRQSAPQPTAPSSPRSQPYYASAEPQAQPAAPLGRAKSALLDMLPGRSRQAQPPSLDGAVVRANADDRIPSIPVSTGPMASSVRIRVKSEGHFNFGSGTVIGSSPGRATIATCWHIFRGATRESKIEVDTFFTGRHETYVAKLIGADEDADVGIIEVSTDTDWPVCRVAPTEHAPKVEDHVVSIGCGGGQEPTRQSVQVTAIDKYNGPANIECSGMPVRGRSGGGLFNAQGELIGVCSAADKEDKRGFYVGLKAIHNILDRTDLAMLYRGEDSLLADAGTRRDRSRFDASIEPVGFGTSTGSSPTADEFLGGAPAQPPANAVADSANPFAGSADAAGGFGSSVPAVRPAMTQGGAAASAPATQNDDVEIVCIVRSKSKPELGSRVIVIDQSDPRLVELLREYERRSQAQ